MRRRSSAGTAFTDLLFNTLLGFAVLFILATLLINPPARSGLVDPKAEFLIVATWPDGRREDVDLYVQDPGGRLVWFRQRQAGLMHLDRDDLGERNDVVEVGGRKIVAARNQEVVTLRGTTPGEYVVNVHLYRAEGEPVPVAIRVDKLNPRLQTVVEERLVLARQGEERTAARFTLDGTTAVQATNRLPKALVPLRNGG